MSSTGITFHRMKDYLQGYFRRVIFKTYRYLKHPRRLKNNAILRWFALHFLDKQVWRPTQYTLAGGAAVGIFLSMQLLPMQMPFAVILAAVFRVNIPIAVAMCWITNPVTVPPLIPVEHAIGKWALSFLSDVPTTPFPKELPHSFAESWLALKEHAPVMLFGGVVLGGVLAPIFYVAAWVFWDYFQRWSLERKTRKTRNEESV